MNQPIDATYSGLEQIPTAAEATNIADELLSLFLSEKVDRIELVYTKFVSLVSSRPVVQTLLPLDTQGLEAADDEIFRLTSREWSISSRTGKSDQSSSGITSRHDF